MLHICSTHNSAFFQLQHDGFSTYIILISNPAWIQNLNNYIIMYFIPCNPYVRLPKQTSSAPEIILKKTALIWYSSLLYNTLHHTATFGSITKAHTETCTIVPMLANGVKYTNTVCIFTGMQIVIHKWITVFSEPQLASPSKETQSCKTSIQYTTCTLIKQLMMSC